MFCLCSRLSPKYLYRSQGQVLVWFLATVAASAAVLYGVYNVGQLTVSKQKVVNAVDAAALAGSVQQARLLNLMAYGNRSMLVSDALVAQMVSLDSWLRYVQTSTRNLGIVTKLLPGVGQILSQVLTSAARMIDRVEDAYGGRFLPSAILSLDTRKQAIELANSALIATGAIMARKVSRQVVLANKTDFGGRSDQSPQWGLEQGVFDARNMLQWSRFSRKYSGAERTDASYVVRESRDDFSRESGRHGNSLTNFSLLGVNLEKRGGTRLIGFDRWEAQDTLELKTKHLFRTKVIPVGWGRADAGRGGHLYWGSSVARKLAFESMRVLPWSGVSEVTDLTESARRNPTLEFVIAAFRPKGATATTGSIRIAPGEGSSILGSAQMDEKLLSDRVTAIGAAQVYFERPQQGIGDWTAQAWGGGSSLLRQDPYKEYPSLYNPFWQARLAPVKEIDRAILLGALNFSEP